MTCFKEKPTSSTSSKGIDSQRLEITQTTIDRHREFMIPSISRLFRLGVDRLKSTTSASGITCPIHLVGNSNNSFRHGSLSSRNQTTSSQRFTSTCSTSSTGINSQQVEITQTSLINMSVSTSFLSPCCSKCSAQEHPQLA